MTKDPNFSYITPDVNKYTPDFSLVGRSIRHLGNGKIYTVRGFAWMGATDEWGFIHSREANSGPICVRPVSHLTGNRSDNTPRYDLMGYEPPVRIHDGDGI